MNFYSFFLLAVLAVFAMAAPQRVIQKTTIISGGGPGGFRGGPGFGRPAPPPLNRFGPGPFRPQTTVIKKTIIQG